MEFDRYHEIKAFADYVSERCTEHRFTQHEVTVVVACLVDDILNNHPDSTLDQALDEITYLVRGLRKVYAGAEAEKDAEAEKPN